MPSSASLRLASPADGAAVAEIYAPAVALPTSFELEAPSGEEMSRRIDSCLPEWPWIVCELDGNVVGYAYATPHRSRAAYRWHVDVSVYVGEGRHGVGIGRALYESLFAVLVLQGFVTAYGGITLPNGRSTKLHAACGFRPVAIYRQVGYKNGAWHDVAWFERPLQEHPADPAEPLPLDHLEPTELETALRFGLTFLRT